MTTLLLALLVAFAAGFAGWRVVVARRRSAQTQAARDDATRTARHIVIQNVQNVVRVEAGGRAAETAEASSALATALEAAQFPKVERTAPAFIVPPGAPTPAEKPAPLVHPAPAVASEPAEPTRPKTVEQTLVLLVDDSKMVRVELSRLLASHGFQVATAVDGADALKQFGTCCPDLVITDVDMPEMDGFGLVNALRSNPRAQHIPLVMITSAEDRHREEALRVGVGLVMGKPFDEDALIAHIRSFKFFAKAVDSESLAYA